MVELLQGSMWAAWVTGASHDPDVISEQWCSFPRWYCPIHTAGTVQSLFEEHEGELQHLPWPAQSSDLNISEPLWSVLVNRVRGRFQPQPSPPLKQTKDVLKKEWYKILLETFKTCKSPFQVGFRLYWRQKVVQHHINKEMCTVPVLYPLFCPTPV
jgi:hypothetical protein